ncbi:DUF1904 family protein [Nitrincola sp.]|uniref:DUF1904 family protein n=1 Tax=Nitrincola sp. TaxID=1926584 RepID=UPI003A8F0C4F
MPQLQFHGIDSQAVQRCSRQLVDDLCQAMDTTPDNFLLEVMHSTQILSGEVVTPFPFVDVRWFERGQTVRDRSAAVIAQHLNAQGYNPVEIIFTALEANAYYENASHFGD